ncbi:MAG: hypothetical protein WDZ75_00145 [Candidatus Paceibacterota bacterium]
MGTKRIKKPWFIQRPDVLETIRKDIGSHYPDLRLIEQTNRILVKGSFHVEHEGRVLTRYQVRIEFPDDYPEQLPSVYEIGGKIPKTADFHIYTNGSACFGIPEEVLISLGEGWSFLDFLDGPVRNYFIGQSLVALGKPWPFGEHPHGSEALFDVYAKWFGVEDKATIVRYLRYLSKEIVKGHWPCPCNSGLIIRKCHEKEIRDMQTRLPYKIVHQSLVRLAQILKSEEDGRKRL